MDFKRAYLRLTHGADFCLPGRLVDHNVRRGAMPLPQRGRIITLLTEVQDVIDPLGDLRNGHYEIDLWVTSDRYSKVLRGVRWTENITECQPVMLYFVSCEEMADAPEGVQYMAVSATHLPTPLTLAYRELNQLVGDAARLFRPGPEGWNFDQYVRERAARHHEFQLAKQTTLVPISEGMTFDELGMSRAAREANC